MSNTPNKLNKERDDFLRDKLIRLGDMIGDGLHREPGGKWISQEYKKICVQLGYTKPKTRNNSAINLHMERRVNDVKCQKCDGILKQTRSGSKRAKCESCGAKYQLLK